MLRGHGVVVSELGSSASLEGGAGSIPAGGSVSLFENCQVSVRVQFRKKVIGNAPEQCQEQEKSPSDFQLFPGFRPSRFPSGITTHHANHHGYAHCTCLNVCVSEFGGQKLIFCKNLMILLGG